MHRERNSTAETSEDEHVQSGQPKIPDTSPEDWWPNYAKRHGLEPKGPVRRIGGAL